MKTAMQQAIALVKKYENRLITMGVLSYNLELLLEKEKEQIIKAHENGQSEFDSLHYRDKNVTLSNNYYNKTYNN